MTDPDKKRLSPYKIKKDKIVEIIKLREWNTHGWQRRWIKEIGHGLTDSYGSQLLAGKQRVPAFWMLLIKRWAGMEHESDTILFHVVEPHTDLNHPVYNMPKYDGQMEYRPNSPSEAFRAEDR